jgi:hypothetical protein
LVLASPVARAGSIISIGDVDGFGYGSATGFFAANGGPANVGGGGPLTNGDFLPDLNRNNVLATGAGDDFDLRSAAERNNTAVFTGAGVTNVNTLGSRFTDISLSTSYGTSSAANRVLTGTNPNTFGAGGPFPDGSPATLPNQPGFTFRFDVDKSALSSSEPIYFNLVFGDYDVVPAELRITRADGTTRVIPLLRQDNDQGEDGLIQEATATLNFADVFADGGSVWRGTLGVDFLAPNEPYTAFDYVELSTNPLVRAAAVPEPSMLTLGLFGLAAGGWAGWRRGRSTTGAT